MIELTTEQAQLLKRIRKGEIIKEDDLAKGINTCEQLKKFYTVMLDLVNDGFIHKGLTVDGNQGWMLTEKGKVVFSAKTLAAFNQVLTRTIEVFGTPEKAQKWLEHPILAFGWASPLSKLGSRKGVQEVLDQLARIEHGVYS
jgi:hypothetical protein